MASASGAHLRARSACTIRAITSLPWMLQCHLAVLLFRIAPILNGQENWQPESALIVS